MSSEVYYMDARSESPQTGLVAKMLTVFDAAGLDQLIKPGDLVAIKIHCGEWGNTAYLRPVYPRALADRIDKGFEHYRDELWHRLPPLSDPRHRAKVEEATEFLTENVLYPCREIEGFNDHRVDVTTGQLERVLNQLAWGMAVVAGLGTVAGVVLVARGIDQGDRALLRLLFQQPYGLLLLPQFAAVTLLELLPAGRVMSEPFAQLRARGYVLQPQVHRRALFCEAAGPQTLHQDANPVL